MCSAIHYFYWSKHWATAYNAVARVRGGSPITPLEPRNGHVFIMPITSCPVGNRLLALALSSIEGYYC